MGKVGFRLLWGPTRSEPRAMPGDVQGPKVLVRVGSTKLSKPGGLNWLKREPAD